MFRFLGLFFFAAIWTGSPAPNPDLGCGKWMSAEKNLTVQVYKEDGVFKGRLLWFANTDKRKPMDEWTDAHNPNPALRDRKLIGLSILNHMEYEPKSNSWEKGKIYDANSGKEWDASAKIDKDGDLRVTGYWHFKFIGKTMTFTRVP